TAGPVSGTVNLNYTTSAVNGSGLGTIGAGSQAVTVNGTAYNLAAATLGKIVLSPVLVGSTVNPTLSVMNSGPAGSYTEELNASVASYTGNAGSYLSSTNSLTNLGVTNTGDLTFSLSTTS